MSVKYWILGAINNRPAHGYDLKNGPFKKALVDFGINDGQLYPTLKKLEKEGLIQKRIEQQEGAPNKHTYSITAKGREDFMKWLESSDGEERSFRYDFVRNDIFFTRCNFIRYLDRDKAIEKMKRHKKIIEETIIDFQKARDDMSERVVDPFRIKIIEYGIKNQKARLEWLEEFLEEIIKDEVTYKSRIKN